MSTRQRSRHTSVIVASGDGKVNASINGGVDSLVKKGRLATSQAHVGGGALEALPLAILGLLDLRGVGLSSVFDTLDNVGH